MDSKCEIRFQTTENANVQIEKLARFCTTNDIKFSNYYVPQTNPSLLVVQFNNNTEKEKFIQSTKEINVLHVLKLSLYTPQIIEKYKIFIHGLNTQYFWYAEGETLAEKVQLFTDELINSVEAGAIIEHHFLGNGNKPPNKPPKLMTLTFKDKTSAENFLNEDSYFDRYLIRKSQKSWDVKVNLIQCNTCKSLGHRSNNQICTKIKRCGRCLSTAHTLPEDENPECKPQCNSCKSTGHSTSSNTCPVNIKYRKKERERIKRENLTNELLADIADPHIKSLKREVINIKNTVENASISNTTKGNNPNKPVPNNTNINIPAFTAAYVSATISEHYDPGTFQECMDYFALDNKLPTFKFRTPSKKVISGIVSDILSPVRAHNNVDMVDVEVMGNSNSNLETNKSSISRETTNFSRTSSMSQDSRSDIDCTSESNRPTLSRENSNLSSTSAMSDLNPAKRLHLEHDLLDSADCAKQDMLELAERSVERVINTEQDMLDLAEREHIKLRLQLTPEKIVTPTLTDPLSNETQYELPNPITEFTNVPVLSIPDISVTPEKPDTTPVTSNSAHIPIPTPPVPPIGKPKIATARETKPEPKKDDQKQDPKILDIIEKINCVKQPIVLIAPRKNLDEMGKRMVNAFFACNGTKQTHALILNEQLEKEYIIMQPISKGGITIYLTAERVKQISKIDPELAIPFKYVTRIRKNW